MPQKISLVLVSRTCYCRALFIRHGVPSSVPLPFVASLRRPYLSRWRGIANVHATPPKPKPASLPMLATGNGVFIGLLTWLEFNNDVYIRKPLALEGPNEFELQYLDLNMSRQPYVLPFTMEKTNEYLQWDENSQTVQKGSSVLRYDHVRIASCRPIEDAIMATQGIEDGDEVRWIMTSIFDGHL